MYFCNSVAFKSFMKFTLKLLALIAVIVMWEACDRPEQDSDSPQVQLSNKNMLVRSDSICGDWSERVISIDSEDSLHLDLALSDNEGLSQFKIDIHQNFDCHGHRAKTLDWQFLEIYDIEGKEFQQDIKIDLPNNPTAGNYHLSILAIDMSGNESQPLYFDLSILNTADSVKPTLKINRPRIGVDLTLTGRQTLNFSGKVLDNKMLVDNARLRLRYVDLGSGNSFTAWEQDINSDSSEWTFVNGFQMKNTAVAGDYLLELQAFDSFNNASIMYTWNLAYQKD